MAGLAGWMRGAPLLALGFALAATAVRAGDFTFSSVDDDHIAWADAANWTGPGTLPGSSDDATIAAGLLRGAEVTDRRGVNSLVLDSGLNVYSTGQLTAGAGITANAGYFINDGTVIADVVNNTYIASTGHFTGNVVNNSGGAVINDGVDDGRTGVWTGDVVSNSGFIVNSYGIWNGDVASNTGYIGNENGAVWNGDVTNFADISSIDSIWNGDLNNHGVAQMTGTLNGNIVNTGTVWMNGSLKGVGSIVNTGRLGLEDGSADDTLNARSLSGTGVLTVDFDPVTMTSDRVVLSGDYSADTTIELRLLRDFPAVRRIGRAPIVVVGGKNAGSIALADPTTGGGGAIVYELARSADGLAIVARPGDVTRQVADVLAFTTATLGTATAAGLAPGEPCSPAASFRGLHGGASGPSGSVDFSGGELGFDLACLALPQSSATLGLGVRFGLANGTIGGDIGGTVDQRFAGLYARLVDGAFSAVLDGQLAGTNYRLGAMTLDGLSSRISSTASYDLALGDITLAPELGFTVSASEASSGDFGNAGAVRFGSGPALAAHVGTTLSADLALGTATLTPFAGVSLHGDLTAPAATFTDSAGTTAALDSVGQGPYVALALGANLVQAGSLNAGLRADMKLGPQVRDATVSGHLKVSY